MNFYKHHIGDYAQATAHLSFVEDAAYSRMLRKYYAEEKPMPADLKAVQRLVGARSKEEREAVETVLGEFFVLRDDGWHNKRADAELAKANAQAETNRQIAQDREARRKTRGAPETGSTNRDDARNDSSHESLHDSLSTREPSQTPDSISQTPDNGVAPPAAQVPPTPSRVAKRREPKQPEVTFADWADAEKTAGRRAMPAGDPIFGYADKVGLPLEFLHLAWREFVARYTADPIKGEKQKTYTDWRAVFRKAVREGWLKLWYLEGQQYLLTTAGQQAQRAHQAPGEAVPQANTGRRLSRSEERALHMDALTGRDRLRASGQRAAMGEFVDVDARRVDGADAAGPSSGVSSEQAIVPTEAPPSWL